MRALVQAAVLGSVVAVAIGGAYWAGGFARADVVHARMARLAGSGLQSGVSAQIADAGEALLVPAVALSSPRGSTSALPPARLIRTAYAAPPSARPFQLRAVIGEESRDLECLGQAIYFEARGETSDGQAAVAQVVLNRVRHKSYPKTVCGVVFQHSGAGCQFSFACHGAGKPPVESAAWRRSKSVAARMLAGEVMAAVGDATAFHAGRSEVAGMLKVAQIGAHAFYRLAGRAGAPAMFRGFAQPSAGPEGSAVVSTGSASAGRVFASTAAAVHYAVNEVSSPFQPAVAQPSKMASLAVSEASPSPKPAVGPQADRSSRPAKASTSEI